MSHLPTLRQCATALLACSVLALLLLVVGPRTGAYRVVTILSDSMRPTFAAGDMIIVTPMPTSQVRSGDVISYEAPTSGHPVMTHRVVEVIQHGTRPVLVTKGDAGTAADPWRVRLEGDTVWRQRAVLPVVGSALQLVRDAPILSLVASVAPMMLLLAVMVDIWRPRAKLDDDWQPVEWDDALGEWDRWVDELDEQEVEPLLDIELPDFDDALPAWPPQLQGAMA